ncbi:MAG: hypothetical protein HFF73_03695 [Oscillospiraceae bacterium]|nr:hypothetical protein [Oscillospiraceae bacterium]
MIRRHVSAALLVRDAFTGRALPADSATLCTVDGQRCAPVWKDGGYLVLTDLPAGAHTITLRRRGYLEETLTAPVADGRTWEGWTSLRPGPGYAFPAGTAWVTLRLLEKKKPLAGAAVWLAPDGGGRLKLAQDRAEAGNRELRLFYSGPESRLPVPGDFLIADRKAPETAALEFVQAGRAELARPLEYGHVRGKELMFARQYRTDGDGQLSCVLRQSGKLWVLWAGRLSELDIQPGENRLDVSEQSDLAREGGR